jgi:hypothetical protein
LCSSDELLEKSFELENMWMSDIECVTIEREKYICESEKNFVTQIDNQWLYIEGHGEVELRKERSQKNERTNRCE